jgi:hypothetical protein
LLGAEEACTAVPPYSNGTTAVGAEPAQHSEIRR